MPLERLVRLYEESCADDGWDYPHLGTALWEREMDMFHELKRRGYSFPAQAKDKKRLRDQHKISKTLRFKILSRDGFCCVYCGNRPPAVVLHIDHVVPISKGGKTVETNLVAACFGCNMGKRDREIGGRS